jgi:hypothetical protein
MKFIIWFIWIIICTIIAVFIIDNEKIKANIKLLCYWFALLITGAYVIVSGYYETREYNNRNHYIDTQIREKLINGQVVKSDTIYVIKYFKPEKK